ncbi:uncharacterized protein Nmlp_3541 [Natronomonas moolapensis 8.8.11]|uniref:Uncharacterized protein n=1 Tax=Natronomonas moolapensis (strain DSM 18674 / CECT 7526 / JCM 14361 / 8.8.11) TaxID=268739 RepID=M1XLG3_NATM8|nr:uncharacterized protein Nmlp_3541 [Natronomonas moolapensis 8.8.11]
MAAPSGPSWNDAGDATTFVRHAGDSARCRGSRFGYAPSDDGVATVPDEARRADRRRPRDALGATFEYEASAVTGPVGSAEVYDRPPTSVPSLSVEASREKMKPHRETARHSTAPHRKGETESRPIRESVTCRR